MTAILHGVKRKIPIPYFGRHRCAAPRRPRVVNRRVKADALQPFRAQRQHATAVQGGVALPFSFYGINASLASMSSFELGGKKGRASRIKSPLPLVPSSLINSVKRRIGRTDIKAESEHRLPQSSGKVVGAAVRRLAGMRRLSRWPALARPLFRGLMVEGEAPVASLVYAMARGMFKGGGGFSKNIALAGSIGGRQ